MDFILTQGIVLKKKLRGEHDGEVTLFTYEFGKIRALAISLFKLTSRLSSRLEPTNYVSAYFTFSKDRFRLVNVYLNEFFNFYSNKEKLKTALFITSMYDLLIPERFADEHLFNFLLETLRHLKKEMVWSSKITAAFKLLFLGRFLQLLGYLNESDLKDQKSLVPKIKQTIKKIVLNLA